MNQNLKTDTTATTKILVLLSGGVIVFGLSRSIGETKQGMAALAGYLLFTANFFAINWLYGNVVRRMKDESARSGGAQGKLGLALFVSVLKFGGLIALLYVLLVRLALSGLYVAFGSLMSLGLLSALSVLGTRAGNPAEKVLNS